MKLYENIIMDFYRKLLKAAADANGISTHELDELAACFEIDLVKLTRITIRKTKDFETAAIMLSKEIKTRLDEFNTAMDKC